MPEFQEVDVQNPVIQSAIRNMIKNGDDNARIVRVVGMPHEVVQAAREWAVEEAAKA